MRLNGWQDRFFSEVAYRVADVAEPGSVVAVTPYIALENIDQQNLHLNSVSRADQAVSGKIRFESGDVLFGKLRPYFRKVVHPRFAGVCSTDIWVLRPRQGVDQSFLFYTAASQRFVEHATRGSTGTKMPRADWTQVSQLSLPLPPLPEQREIASILGALDDKIALNRRMNATLEAMARALFQSWFVDFDPVRAKAEGRQPVGMDANTAALFPDSFEDSALGPIPTGWEVTNLGAVLNELETGRRPKGGVASYTSGVPSVGAESINGVGVFDYSKTKYVPKDFYDRNPSGRVKDWDVLLYKDGGKPGEFRPRVGMYALGFPFESFSINEHVFRMRADQIGQTFLYFTVSSHRALEDFANKGGKAAIPGINQPDVKSTLLVLPVAKVLLQFNQIAQQLAEKIIRNAASSKRYSELRDTLLPKLLSGELRVGEVAA
jgi:type I restriction enzyme S subunit